MPPSKFRDDINIVGMPLTEICNAAYTDPRQRQLFKNIIYVGALSALLDIDLRRSRALIGEQFKGKDKLIAPNFKALPHGPRLCPRPFECPLGLKVRHAPTRSATRSSSTATTRGARRRLWRRDRSPRGIRSRPSTSLAEAFQRYCRRYRTDPATGKTRYAIVQAEDELASIGIVIGAAWNGARAFTGDLRPRHLADEGVPRPRLFRRDPGGAFRRAARRPVDRHADAHAAGRLLSCAYASPRRHQARRCCSREDPNECFEMGAQAFDLADRLQTPVFVMLDLDIGMNEWLCRRSPGTTSGASIAAR